MKPKVDKVKRVSWIDVATESGFLSKKSGGQQRVKAKAELQGIDSRIKFPAGGMNPEEADWLLSACQVAKARKDPSGEIEKSKEAVDELPDNLPKTAKQKLDSAIRAHIRLLDAEAEYHLQERLKQELEVFLPDYNEAHDKNIAFVNSYHGVMTHGEYKLVIGLLHADKYPEIDDVQRARLDKGFHLMKIKKELLCGLSDRNKLSNSLPKTVADLWARRK